MPRVAARRKQAWKLNQKIITLGRGWEESHTTYLAMTRSFEDTVFGLWKVCRHYEVITKEEGFFCHFLDTIPMSLSPMRCISHATPRAGCFERHYSTRLLTSGEAQSVFAEHCCRTIDKSPKVIITQLYAQRK